MIVADRDGDSIALYAPLVTTSRAKDIPGARHDNRARCFRLPLSWASCVIMRGIFGDELQVKPALADWAWTELKTRIEPAMAAREAVA